MQYQLIMKVMLTDGSTFPVTNQHTINASNDLDATLLAVEKRNSELSSMSWISCRSTVVDSKGLTVYACGLINMKEGEEK